MSCRYLSVVRRCSELGLLSRCVRLPARSISREELRLCHDESLLELLQATKDMTVQELQETSSQFDCLYIHPASWETALLSAGGVTDLVRAVARGDLNNGLALVRPPGHHAMRSESCGYCYVNNIAIAARAALASLERILIIDWDVHHGQGTQREFYEDKRVMYVSIHRHEDGYWWPNLRESDHAYTGAGEGAGYNVNIPLNVTGEETFILFYLSISNKRRRMVVGWNKRFMQAKYFVNRNYDRRKLEVIPTVFMRSRKYLHCLAVR